MVRILESYLRDISREPVLDHDTEVRLARRVRAGDEAARRRLVTAHLGFVVGLARRYRSQGLSMTDLVNEGNIGLVRAADLFDPDRGVRFMHYAQFWVRREMLRAVARQEDLRRPGGPAPIRISLDDHGSGAERPVAEMLADDQTPDPSAGLVREKLRDALEASLTDLPPRESDVVRRYFGLAGEAPESLAQISSELRVTRERARQLKERGLARLRARAGRHGLGAFLDSGPRAPRTRI